MKFKSRDKKKIKKYVDDNGEAKVTLNMKVLKT